ncbi:hypothetical protein LTR04_000638 [Oleoguttula sp. CCFEE 6159]|nr:hypothetical protein LTR04_000638 [Oleoguttula sp. CCFEE 6159]
MAVAKGRPRRQTMLRSYMLSTPSEEESAEELGASSETDSDIEMEDGSEFEFVSDQEANDDAFEDDEEPGEDEHTDETSVFASDDDSELGAPQAKRRKILVTKAAPKAIVRSRAPGRISTQKKLSKPKPSKKITKNPLRKPANHGLGTEDELPMDTKRTIDLTLPPMSDIEEIFENITSKALESGFRGFVEQLEARPLRVATMCSGTESPLLALQLVAQSLSRMNESTFDIDHLFSAEIVPFKQAYIERNFQPPIIFRDIRELEDDAAETSGATTAYGAKIPVPGDVDLLVAGFSCVDFSALNNRSKDLNDRGESGDTFNAVLAYANKWRPSIVVLENVSNAPWDDIQELLEKIDYACAWQRVDTKDYYLPQTRRRGYLVGVDQRQYGKGVQGAVEKWGPLMQGFQRPASCGVSSFFLPDDDPRVQRARADLEQQAKDGTRTHDVEWAACRERHVNYRRNKNLGVQRPLTHWVDNGTCGVPEYADRAWYRKQVERVWDNLDCSLLRNATPPWGQFDAQFKTRVWEPSQNIDFQEDQGTSGFAPCQTPTGNPYISDRGGPLIGYETLVLQGIPIHKISLTVETDRQLQDLGGNAMSSTVVGCAIISSLIIAHGALRKGQRQHGCDGKTETSSKVRPLILAGETDLEENRSTFEKSTLALHWETFVEDARKSARRCYCEGRTSTATDPVQVCGACAHTICLKCGGNPKHQYGDQQVKKDSRISPAEFEERWKTKLPAALSFKHLPDLRLLQKTQDIDVDLSIWEDFVAAIDSALHEDLHFQNFKRSESWTIVYNSPNATLQLKLSSKPEWQYFVKPARSLAGDSRLRKFLQHPIARSTVASDAFLGNSWQWFLPGRKEFPISVEGEGGTTSSWFSRLGLSDYQEQQVSCRLRVSVSAAYAKLIGEDLSGIYELLPECGTASGSLHKRLPDGRGKDDEDNALFLFLDPDRIGPSREDSFVFSREHRRLEYGETRNEVARISPRWRSWELKRPVKADGFVEGQWVEDQNAATQLSVLDTSIVFSTPRSTGSVNLPDRCSHAMAILSCSFPAPKNIDPRWTTKQEISLADKQFFTSFAWVLEQTRRIPALRDWRSLGAADSIGRCETCAPTPPSIKWRRGQGPRDSFVPYEDQKNARGYEHKLKVRPSLVHLEANLDSDTIGHIKVGLNINSLAHRAAAKLGERGSATSMSWNLDTNYIPPPKMSFPKYRLLSNINDDMYPTPRRLKLELKPEQKRSLGWMRAQEASTGTLFALEETEEVLIPQLRWKAEARAQRDIYVRGGVLADQVSYGKTVITLALIEAEFAELDRKEILERFVRCENSDRGLIDIQATLIVCPPNLPQQWRGEITKFLGNAYHASEVLLVRTMGDLMKHSIKDFQSAKIILVSWNLLSNDGYLTRLSRFAAVPGCTSSSGRAFRAWLEYALGQVNENTLTLREHGAKMLRNRLDSTAKDILENEAFKGVIPSKRLKGQAYIDGKEKSKKSTKAPKPAASKTPTGDPFGLGTKPVQQSWQSLKGPLLQMFRFNRVVIDEYTYLEGKDHTSITSIQGDKRWVLSGTPPLDNFGEVKRIASFLNINLGIDDDTPGMISAQDLKKIRKERTGTLFRIVNDTDLEDIDCVECLLPVDLQPNHRATYLELSHHLNTQDMRMRKASKNLSGDKEKRVNASLGDATTPEEALLRSCSFFTGEGCEDIISVREQEHGELRDDIRKLLRRAEKLRMQCGEIDKHYGSWKLSVEQNSLGDADTTQNIKDLIQEAASFSRNTVLEDDEDKAKDVKAELRTVTLEVANMARALASRSRGIRFIVDVRMLQESFSESSAESVPTSCSSGRCHGSAISSSTIGVSLTCGHIICDGCLEDQRGKGVCPVAGCDATLTEHSLVKAKDLGKTNENKETTMYGQKLEDVISLMENLPEDDQIILFIQGGGLMQAVARALRTRSISHHAIVGKADDKSENKISDFQSNRDPATRKKALLLDVAGVAASGLNLTNANHVIFLSPLLADSQYLYESNMTQAIGRARRFGQVKNVCIYRFVALKTIDVEILEQRERRADALEEYKPGKTLRQFVPSSTKLATRKEKTQLIRDAGGSCRLVPRSWLLERDEHAMDETRAHVRNHEDLSSLIKFSQAFMEDD